MLAGEKPKIKSTESSQFVDGVKRPRVRLLPLSLSPSEKKKTKIC